MIELLSVITPVFVLILLGLISVKLNVLSSDDYASLTSFVMKISFPCLLLTKLSILDISRHFRWDILLIFASCSLLLAITSIQFFHRVLKRQYTLSVLEGGIGTSLSNNGFIGYPILLLVFSNPPMTTYATVLLVENLIMIPFIIVLLNRNNSKADGVTMTSALTRRLLKNPILISVASGLLISLMSIKLPNYLMTPLSFLGATAAPLALFAIGMALIKIPSITQMTDIAWTAFGKLLLHPLLVAISCAFFVDSFSDPDIYALILLASSPMASLYPTFGANYGAPNLTASALTSTTLLSFITISAWILVLGI